MDLGFDSSPLWPLGSEKSYCKDHTVETRKHNSQSITLQSVQKLHVTFVSRYCWSIKCFETCDLELQTVFWDHPRQRIELLGSFVKSSFNLDLNVFCIKLKLRTEELSEVFARVAVLELQTSWAMRNRNGSEGHKVNVCLLIYSLISYHYWHWTVEWMLCFSGNHSDRHKIRLFCWSKLP